MTTAAVNDREIYYLLLIFVSILGAVVIGAALKEDATKSSIDTEKITYFGAHEIIYNITVPEINATHYCFVTPTGFLIDTTLYEFKQIPECHIIPVPFYGKMQIHYWSLEENGLYRLVYVGVYDGPETK